MEHKIDWKTAAVQGQQLTVALANRPDSAAMDPSWTNWERIFSAIASRQIAGVPYTMSAGWGQVGIKHGVIYVANVSDRIVDFLRGHLDAAVEATNEAWAREDEERVRVLRARREQQRLAAERDKELTERFRQSA